MDAIAQLNSSLTGRYKIGREIGRGGMAAVYLAHDVRHERKVALKVLNPELGAVLGGERFLSEIRVTANLQHPNLLPLFDSGDAEGHLYYVMPFVEGESLRARLDREKQLPVDEAIRIARAVASALDYAHSHGVIHRDLKPENILMQAGQPVLADFGIALAVANAGGTRITQTGLSLGTPQYMSPEQATGDRVIDGRTDIYSLGAVLYEMLTGDPPYSGSTAQAIIARLLTEKPRSVRGSRDTVPEFVEAALERALAKLPADRFATAREFGEALEGSRTASSLTTPQTFSRDVRLTIAFPVDKAKRVGKWIAISGIIAAGVWGWARPVPEPGAPRARFVLNLPDSVRPREDVGGSNVTLSPDGTLFAYIGGERSARIFVRNLNELNPRPVPGTEGAATPRFSPDGKWLAFTVGNQLRKIPLGGGPMTVIADTVSRYTWGEKDVIVFGALGSGAGGLFRVSAAGGPVTRLTTPDTTLGETGHTWPEFLPGGESIVFTTQKALISTSELAVMTLDGGEPIRLGIVGVNPRYVSSGHIVFGSVDDGSVTALPFDARRLRITGAPITLLSDIVIKGGGATEIAVSRSGTLGYIEGAARNSIVRVDAPSTTIPLTLGVAQNTNWPRISPSGELLAFEAGDSRNIDIWIYNFKSRTTSRLTRDGRSQRPTWTHDGRRLAWQHVDSGKVESLWQAWDGSGRPEVLDTSGRQLLVADFSRNGDFFVSTARAGREIWLTTLATPRVTRLLTQNNRSDFAPRISPNGRWVAYTSNVSGSNEVYLTPTSETSGGSLQVTIEGGIEPVWAPDGQSIFYRNSGRVMRAVLSFTPEFIVTRRDTAFTVGLAPSGTGARYDMLPDGRSLIGVLRGDGNQRAVIVFGWLDELRERMKMAAGR